MKKLILFVFVGCLTFMFIPQTAFSQKSETNSSLLISKPAEIKTKDRSTNEKMNLSKSDLKISKNSKHQQTESNLEMRQQRHGGAYISVGGILLIILLVVLIF